MTVAELIRYLQQFAPETVVLLDANAQVQRHECVILSHLFIPDNLPEINL